MSFVIGCFTTFPECKKIYGKLFSHHLVIGVLISWNALVSLFDLSVKHMLGQIFLFPQVYVRLPMDECLLAFGPCAQEKIIWKEDFNQLRPTALTPKLYIFSCSCFQFGSLSDECFP